MSGNPNHLRRPEGFGPGTTAITRLDDETGIDFGILRLRAGEAFDCPTGLESAYTLLNGEVRFRFGGADHARRRGSLLDEDPVVLHLPAGTAARLTAASDAELAVTKVVSTGRFEPTLFDGSSMLEAEQRDQGKLDGTSHRLVRTVFDTRNRPDAMLVVGEVITFPGRWSSYPPHHHPQPEIYHYRFSEPQGFGFGELGADVVRIRPYDTVKILDGQDHAQVAAPGYAMWYLWVIRHLPGNKYVVPEFTQEHRWLREPDAKVWRAPTGP